MLISLVVLSWRLLFTLCVWIRIEVDGLADFRQRLGDSGRPVVLVANHLSFLDPLLIVSLASLSFAGNVRVLVANYVFNIPLLGTIMRRMGLPEVPFKASAKALNLEVDCDLMDDRLRAFADHVQSGGVGSWFPEGLRNRGDPHQLQMFRAGSFVIPARLDVEIWCIALVGTNLTWPTSTLLGGRPSRVGAKCFRLAESSRALLAGAPLPEPAAERERAVFLAERCKEAVQAELDALVARGFSGRESQQGS